MINIPNDLQRLNSLPEDPPNSISYGKETSSTNIFMMIYPINNTSAMPYDNERMVIDGIHSSLAEDQGLIEVKSGTTNNGKKFIYSIVKSKLNPSGVQYTLVMHLNMNNYTININSYFDEIGITGTRETTIMNKLINEGKLTTSNMQDWVRDPYDSNFKKGFLMNIGEDIYYDPLFPLHPLSEARKLIKYLIENN